MGRECHGLAISKIALAATGFSVMFRFGEFLPTGERICDMHKDGDRIDVTEVEASGGVKNVGLRYMLAISLLLAVIILSAMWMTKAALT